MIKRKQKSKVPKFKTLEEEAEFWDTHDSTDFEDEFEEVELKFVRPLRHVFEIELDAADLDRLTKLATSLGVKPSALVQRWIREKAAEEPDLH